MFDKECLVHVMPYCKFPDQWVRPLQQAMEKFEINTDERQAAFLGQIAHESGELNTLQENLNYSPRRILEIWPSRFETLKDAQPFSRNPERLANRVYADRLGNGPENLGDGYRYRGRGLIQITGKTNYERIGKLIDYPSLPQLPDVLLEPIYAALSAAAFWQDNGLNELADLIPFEDNIVERITKKVNGGVHGLQKRQIYTERALRFREEEDAWLDF